MNKLSRADSEYVNSSSSLSVNFKGDNDIYANTLVNTVNNLIDLLDEATSLCDAEALAKLKITNVKHGSFVIEFGAFVSLAPIISSSACTILQTIIHALKIKQFLKNDKPDSVEKGDETTKITYNGENIIVINNSYNLYNRPTANEKISDFFSDIAQDTTHEGLELISEGEKLLFTPTEIKELSIPTQLKDLDVIMDSIENERQLIIRKPDLMCKSKWEFYDSGRISATIEDEEFINRVKSGEVSFTSGDRLDAILKTEFELDNNNLPKEGSERHYVTKVINIQKKKTTQTQNTFL